MTNPHAHTMQHCREVIKACLNIVEERGDTYVAIHKDEDTECVVLVSMIRSYRIMSVIVADKILFAKEHEADMYRSANELNSESVAGWHTLVLTDSNSIYMYRQCIWMSDTLSPDYLMDILCQCIAEYRYGRARLSPGSTASSTQEHT